MELYEAVENNDINYQCVTENALTLVCKNNYIDILKLLINDKRIIIYRIIFHVYILTITICYNHYEIVKFLLKNEKNINSDSIL